MKEKRPTKPVRLNLVEIARTKGMDSPVVGHLWPTTGRIALLSEVDEGLELNGLTFMRKNQIGSIKSSFSRRKFYSALLPRFVNRTLVRLRGSINSTNDWGQVTSWIQAHAVLVAVHCELADPDICYVGLIVNSGAKLISLQPISSNGKWITTNQLIELGSISKIEVSNRYLRSFSRYINKRKMFKQRVR